MMLPTAGAAGPTANYDLTRVLTERIEVGIRAAYPDSPMAAAAQVRSSAQPKFGDFQANFAMALGKALGKPPREVAESVVAAADLSGLAERVEIAGPGFLNIHLRTEAIAAALVAMEGAELGVPQPGTGQHPVAIDLCGVNVAKQMHVGHLRATIIGDTLARIHERLGWRATRQNHLGDWGLPIAMTIAALRRIGADLSKVTLDDLNIAYRAAQEDASDAAQAEAKRTLLALQAGSAAEVADWNQLIAVTMKEVFEAAAILGVHLTPEHSRGESFFRDQLAGVVDEFLSRGIARVDDGAVVVPFADRERPLLIRKSDGGFMYSTTDLAAIRYRVQTLGAGKVVYVVDARQRDHFRDVFDAVRLIGWDKLPDGTQAELIHLPFGAVLGDDRKPLKTRSGRNVTLMSLLSEAIERGRAQVRTRAAQPESPTGGLCAAELDGIGLAVGIAAVKYADLSNDVTSDYTFDIDRMVSFEGDTGPYIQYAHARIGSIVGKAGDSAADITTPIDPAEPNERALALRLLRYGAALRSTATDLQPARLCAYLFDLANAYNGFYQSCPVLKCPDPKVAGSRLHLCELTRRTLADGLSLLGITAPPKM